MLRSAPLADSAFAETGLVDLFCFCGAYGQNPTHFIGEDGGHALLNVGNSAANRMPAVGDAADFLGVLGIDQAVLIFGNRMERIFRKTDVFVELNDGESPFFGELADCAVVGCPGVVPMGGEDDDRGFSGSRFVVAGVGVVAEFVAFGGVAFDDVIEGGGVIGFIERCFVILP